MTRGCGIKLNDSLILEPQRLTSPTVKVRRLGYIAIIPSLVSDREISPKTLEQNLVGWAKQNRSFLRLYSSKLPVANIKRSPLTGEITNPDAARRYLETCRELGFITRLRKVQISKIGRVISIIPERDNPFELSIGKLFIILKRLLEKDYDVLKTIHKILLRGEADEIDFFRRELQRILSKKIEMAAQMNDFYLIDKLKKSLKSIQSWESAERYYRENIKAPRLEWMLDLQFLAFWNKRSNTFRLMDNLDVFFEKEVMSYEWLQDIYPYIFSKFYSGVFKKKMEQWPNLSPKEKIGILENLLNNSMQMFKTVTDLDRISADEFFEYSLASLIQNNDIAAGLSDLEKDLTNFVASGELKFRYVKTVSKADRGYILRI